MQIASNCEYKYQNLSLNMSAFGERQEVRLCATSLLPKRYNTELAEGGSAEVALKHCRTAVRQVV